MESTFVIKKSIDEVIKDFPMIVKEGKLMQLKKLNEKSFRMASLASFGNFNAIEKEHFYVSGHFKEVGNNTEIKYRIRGNSTFKILSIVIPLMSLPTVFIPLVGTQSNEEWQAVFIKNVLIYLIFNGLCLAFLFLKDKKLRLEGENSMIRMFKND